MNTPHGDALIDERSIPMTTAEFWADGDALRHALQEPGSPEERERLLERLAWWNDAFARGMR